MTPTADQYLSVFVREDQDLDGVNAIGVRKSFQFLSRGNKFFYAGVL